MSDFTSSLDDILSKKPSQGGYSKERLYDYAQLADGETKTYRFITGFEFMYVFSHKCGLEHYEVTQESFDQAKLNGAPMKCPQCGELLTLDDITYKRPRGLLNRVHTWVPTAKGRKGTFVCQGDGCPLCAERNEEGKRKFPAVDRLTMYAIECQKVVGEPQLIGGIQRQTLKDIVPMYNDDGTLRIVQFERAPLFFTVPYYSVFKKEGRADHYSFDVSRMGEGKSTQYAISRVSGDPSAWDSKLYADALDKIMDSTVKLYKGIGTPEYYAKNGFGVGAPVGNGGFVSANTTAHAPAVAPTVVSSATSDKPTVAWETVQSDANGRYL